MAARRFDFTSKVRLDRDENAIAQLGAQIGAAIRKAGKEAFGAALVSERQAADTLEVSRSAVHRAYENLSAEGLLERAPGSRRYRVREFTKTNPGQCVGVILPYDFIRYVGCAIVNPVRHRLLAGIIDRTMHLGLGVRFLTPPPPESPRREVNEFMKSCLSSLAGIIHLGSRGFADDSPLEAIWENRLLPQVFLLSRSPSRPHCGSVTYDAAGGLAAMARHLQELGHDKIALFHPVFETRKLDLQYTLEQPGESVKIFRDAGLEVRDEWLVTHMPDEGEKELARKLDKLLSQPGRPNAIWGRNDKTALILMRLLKERGLGVPDDISVTGMDDITEGRESAPSLTTLEAPYYDCGKSAVDMLLAARTQGDTPARRAVKIPMTLVVRGSTGANKKQTTALGPL